MINLDTQKYSYTCICLTLAISTTLVGCSNTNFSSNHKNDVKSPTTTQNPSSPSTSAKNAEAETETAVNAEAPKNTTVFTVDGQTVTLGRSCHILMASSNKLGLGSSYFPSGLNFPASVTVTKVNLYQQHLQASDLAGVDLFVYADAAVVSNNIDVDGWRTLDDDEYALLTAASKRKMGMSFAFDNSRAGPSSDASLGSRTIISKLTSSMSIDPNCVAGDPSCYEQQQKIIPADTNAFPFLSGVTFDFTGGLNSPGQISVAKPALCIVNPSGYCRVAYLPETNEQGFIFANGNVGQGSALYLARLIEKQCQ